ncbi:10704_t:CDS:2 [Acaulospora morrowiae]|uniref:10704_t:CDS:1 n=1 Tax=Acaulospora morrowiae TaxID=94023 RepID=A0A9N8VSX8_9GLOM|nr:10704_t:CDS:2 [Acaulospora morrowiae]
MDTTYRDKIPHRQVSSMILQIMSGDHVKSPETGFTSMPHTIGNRFEIETSRRLSGVTGHDKTFPRGFLTLTGTFKFDVSLFSLFVASLMLATITYYMNDPNPINVRQRCSMNAPESCCIIAPIQTRSSSPGDPLDDGCRGDGGSLNLGGRQDGTFQYLKQKGSWLRSFSKRISCFTLQPPKVDKLNSALWFQFTISDVDPSHLSPISPSLTITKSGAWCGATGQTNSVSGGENNCVPTIILTRLNPDTGG